MAEDSTREAHRRCGWLKRISLADEQVKQLRRTVIWFALVQISFVVGTAASERPVMNKTDLFEAGTGGYATYRIPGIVVTSSCYYMRSDDDGRTSTKAVDINRPAQLTVARFNLEWLTNDADRFE